MKIQEDINKQIEILKKYLMFYIREFGQVKVAKVCGTSQAHLSLSMRDHSGVKIDTLIRWIEALGYQVTLPLYDTGAEVPIFVTDTAESRNETINKLRKA